MTNYEFVEFLDQLLDYESIANVVMKTNCPVVKVYYDILERKLVAGCFSSTNDDLSYDERKHMVTLYTWSENDELWVDDDDMIQGDDDELYEQYKKDQADSEFPRESFVYWLRFNHSDEYLRRLKTYIIENMSDQDLQAEWIDKILERVKVNG